MHRYTRQMRLGGVFVLPCGLVHSTANVGAVHLLVMEHMQEDTRSSRVLFCRSV